MSGENFGNKRRFILACSIAANIFLVAFLLGRVTLPGAMPPPPFMMGGEDPMMMPPPPPPMQGAHHRPPPPFFGPSSLFSPDEMSGALESMQQSFEKIKALRADFAQKLKANTVSKEDVLQHFGATDALMDDVRRQTQEKAAAKISTMSPEDRQRFADRLLQEGR